MFIWIVAALIVAVFVVSRLASIARRRPGLLDLGSVSTNWLAEHREYQEGDRLR